MKNKRLYYYILILSLLCTYSHAEERIDMEGISIIGNKELPNVLYIVPWKSAELPDMSEPPLDTLINAALDPVDRESILRNELYYKALKTKSASLKK